MNNTFFNKQVFHIVTVIISVSVIHNVVFAQSKPGYDDKLLFRGMSGVTLGGVVQHWTLTNGSSESIIQQSAPIAVSVPVSNRILLSVSSAGAMANYDTASLNGITDTRLSVSYVLPGDKVWLVGGVNIPTGKTKLTTKEIQVSSLLSQTSFAYKVPVYGQGINANLGATYAASITRRFVLGLGTSVFYKGKYEPVSVGTTKFVYDPGDEISANIGADYITFSKKYRFSLDISGTYFLNDELDGKKIVQSGPRVIAIFVASTKTESFNHLLQIRGRVRGDNTYFTRDSVERSEKLKSAVQFEAHYSISKTLTNWLFTTGTIETKTFTEDRIPFGKEIVKTGKANLFSLGADAVFMFSQDIIPTLNVKYGKGTLLLNGIEYDISGIEAGVTVKVSF